MLKFQVEECGISGGTIDKLASIPGFNPNISLQQFKENVQDIGISIVSEELDLAPAESKFYKLRNEISCRDDITLIAISLMSLKVATGSNKIAFDISCGKGTYLDNIDSAKRLGKLLVKIGKKLNKDVDFVITEMNEPIGKSVGNILEIKETVNALKGDMTKDLRDTVVSLAHVILRLATGENDLNKNYEKIKEVIDSGKALKKFKQMVEAQRWKYRIFRRFRQV